MSELELTDIEKAKRIEEAKLATQKIIQESNEKEHKLARETYKNVMNKFTEIEEKNRCFRVRFLDWLSDKLLDYSRRAHELSTRISKPCAIKLPENKNSTSNAKIAPLHAIFFARNGNIKSKKS